MDADLKFKNENVSAILISVIFAIVANRLTNLLNLVKMHVQELSDQQVDNVRIFISFTNLFQSILCRFEIHIDRF